METTVPVEDLRAAGFGDEIEKVATAVAEYLDDGTGRNVAIISEPYAGRDALVRYAESLLDGDATRRNLDPSAADGDGPSIPDGGVVYDGEANRVPDGAGRDGVAKDGGLTPTERSGNDVPGDDSRAGALVATDCHHLFDRHIDGFETLDAFLDRLALSDALVVTSWNRYAWSYLDAVRDVGDSFSVTIEIPRLDADELRTVIEANSGMDLPDIVDTGQAGRVKTMVFDRHTIGLPGGRTVAIPYPKPNTAWLASWAVRGEAASVEAVVFEKLRRVSQGNPGVAKAAWERSIEDGEIAPGYIETPETDLSVDDGAAFLLWNVVVMESASIERLETLFEDLQVEATLHDLTERNLVSVEEGTVSIAPESLHLAVAVLERRQLLW